MSKNIPLTPQKELCLQVENAVFRLLIEKPDENDGSEDLYITMHSHVFAEIFFCKEGTLTITIPGGTLTLKENDVAIIPPGIKHFAKIYDTDSSYSTICFLCQKKGRSAGADIYKMLSPFVLGRQIVIYKNSPSLCSDAEKIIKKASNDTVLTVISTVELLLNALKTPSKKLDLPKEQYSDDSLGSDIQRMMDLDQLINTFFMRDFTADEVAKQLFISKRQLDRVVRKRYGKTFRSVIIKKRLDVAEEMLITTDMTTESIGTAVGFGSKPSFYREFTKEYGITPAAFRKKLKNQN